MAQTTVAINLEAKTKGTESIKGLKSQLQAAVKEADLLAAQFGVASEQAVAAAQKVADLKEQVGDVQKNVQALGLNKFQTFATMAQGVANGLQAAQGAMALFGSESEDVQKALLKVQGAMALSQGLEGLLNAGKQFKTLGQSAVDAFKSMTTASKAFLATGIGLLITGIALLIANFDKIAESLGFAKSEMEKMNEAMNVAADQTKLQAADLNFYNSVVQDTNKSEGERLFALEQLKKAGIATDDVNIANANSLGELNNRVQQHIQLIKQRARVEAAAQILQEKTKRLIEMQNGDLQESLTWWDNVVLVTTTGLHNVDKLQSRMVERVKNNMKDQQKSVDDAAAALRKEQEAALKLEGQATATNQKVASTLKLRTEAEKKAGAAAKETIDLEQEALQRRAQMAALDQSTLEKAIEAADLAFLVRVKQLKKEGYTEIEIGKQRDAALEKVRDEFAAKQKAKDEQDAKDRQAFQKTLQENLIKANDAYFKSRELQILKSGKSAEEIQKELDALELERLQSNFETQQATLGEQSNEAIAAEIELNKKKKELYDADIENRKNAEKEKIELTKSGFETIGQLTTAFAGKSEEAQRRAFEINKAASIATAIIDTYVAAQGAFKSQMSIKTPDAPVRAAIAAGLAIAQGLARVATIKKTQFQSKDAGGGGGGGAAGTPAAPALTPTVGGGLPDEQQFGGMGRVYVLEGDITKTQTRVRRLRNTSVV